MEKRRRVCAILVSMVVSSFLFAQEPAAKIAPQKPRIGDEVTITYNGASKAATLASATGITAEILVSKWNDNPVLMELPMTKEGKAWRANFKLTDEKARLLLLRFVAGDQKDDNGENSWMTLVYGTDGKPLEGSYFTQGNILRSGSYVDFRVTKDVDAAKAAWAKERELYPGNGLAMFMQWSVMMRENPGDETKNAIKKELENEYESGKATEDLLPQFISWFEQVGMREKAEELRKAAITKNPKGKVAQAAALNDVYRERDAAKRATAMEKFLADFPQKGAEKEGYESMLLSYKLGSYVSAKKYDEAYAVLESMPKKDGNQYNNLAWPLIEKGEQLEKAVAWAKKGVDLLKNPDPASKPPYLSMATWKKSNLMGLGMVQDTYAYGLYQLGKYPEAEAAYEEAFKLTEGADADVNQRLVDCYVKNGKYEKAIEVATDCIRKSKSNEKMVDAYKTAYVKVKGSDQGFEAALESARNAAKSELKKETLKGMVNKPAVDFLLKDIKGKTVKLSSLRGKVVVVDFWATWCGPCKASFPYLQKVHEQYKSNPNVVILALNTWENVSGKEREDLVKKFMAENKYTFPVLYDQGFVEKYGVEGIPTKFVIDKKGKIQFKSIGFVGGDKMVEELTMQLQMLLDDSFYSAPK